MTIKDWQKNVHDLAIQKGWWDKDEGTANDTLSNLALIHSEVSEAVEEVRITEDLTKVSFDRDGEPEGFGVELADVIIRVLDLAEHHGIDMQKMIALKHEYNKLRPYRHGGKRA